MDWMIGSSSTHKNPDVIPWDVRAVGTESLNWVLNPANPNLRRIEPGDNVIVYSYDDEAFTHIGPFVESPSADGTAAIRLMQLSDAITRPKLANLPEWKTPHDTPRAPFSKANTFSQPVNITQRWNTIRNALSSRDQGRLQSL